MSSERIFNLDFAYGLGLPEVTAQMKQFPEDFIVCEIPSYDVSGQGEHALLKIRKQGCNTDWVAQQLAKFAGIRRRDVGYAGRKDRHAVTTQWFSCWLPGKSDPDWKHADIEGLEILDVSRHNRKLKPGALKGNSFSILLRDIPASEEHLAWLEQRLLNIRNTGVPNYFGVQRFGRGAQNLVQADRLLDSGPSRKRRNRDIYLSAARSYLFNMSLSRRVDDGSWLHRKENGGSGIGALFGLGEFDNEEDEFLRNLEPKWCHALLRLKMKRRYRALILDPVDMNWEYPESGQLRLYFTLPRGCFATAVIRELVRTDESLEAEGEE